MAQPPVHRPLLRLRLHLAPLTSLLRLWLSAQSRRRVPQYRAARLLLPLARAQLGQQPLALLLLHRTARPQTPRPLLLPRLSLAHLTFPPRLLLSARSRRRVLQCRAARLLLLLQLATVQLGQRPLALLRLCRTARPPTPRHLFLLQLLARLTSLRRLWSPALSPRRMVQAQAAQLLLQPVTVQLGQQPLAPLLRRRTAHTPVRRPLLLLQLLARLTYLRRLWWSAPSPRRTEQFQAAHRLLQLSVAPLGLLSLAVPPLHLTAPLSALRRLLLLSLVHLPS